MTRMQRQADANRQAAQQHRDNGNDETAQRLEDRAAALESGRVADRTDDVIALFQAGLRRS